MINNQPLLLLLLSLLILSVSCVLPPPPLCACGAWAKCFGLCVYVVVSTGGREGGRGRGRREVIHQEFCLGLSCVLAPRAALEKKER